MRILTFDFGNSRVKVGFFIDNELQFVEYFSYTENIAAYIYFWMDKFDVEAAGYTNVYTKDVSRHLTDEILQILDVKEITSLTPSLIINKYRQPSLLGSDRFAASTGAALYTQSINHKGGVLTVDIGTAITYDYVNEKKEFIGGAISPGAKMRLRALHQFTSRLPFVKEVDDVELVGTDTRTSMLSGVFHGVAGEIDSFYDKYLTVNNEAGNLLLLFTGGGYPSIQKYLKTSNKYLPNLVLQGINYLTTLHHKSL